MFIVIQNKTESTNATTIMIVDKIWSSFICHSTCYLIGEHTNLMGEQYIREHFDYSEHKNFFGQLKLFSISGYDTVRLCPIGTFIAYQI